MSTDDEGQESEEFSPIYIRTIVGEVPVHHINVNSAERKYGTGYYDTSVMLSNLFFSPSPIRIP